MLPHAVTLRSRARDWLSSRSKGTPRFAGATVRPLWQDHHQKDGVSHATGSADGPLGTHRDRVFVPSPRHACD